MADRCRYLVVPAEWAAGAGFDSENEALQEAALRSKVDRKHLAVVAVLAHTAPTHVPRVVLTKGLDRSVDPTEVHA